MFHGSQQPLRAALGSWVEGLAAAGA
jgi:hypothetical protein